MEFCIKDILLIPFLNSIFGAAFNSPSALTKLLSFPIHKAMPRITVCIVTYLPSSSSRPLKFEGDFLRTSRALVHSWHDLLRAMARPMLMRARGNPPHFSATA
uniref:Uncharacterized protein n=1 Tax=Rhizophora mucronata TaxID=61149 RepID=A0A2P2MY05_RHIMU